MHGVLELRGELLLPAGLVEFGEVERDEVGPVHCTSELRFSIPPSDKLWIYSRSSFVSGRVEYGCSFVP